MSQLIPVVNSSFLYINGLIAQYDGADTLIVTSGQCRDSNNVLDMVLSTEATLNAAVNGFNGLDIGDLAASTSYALYCISDSRGQNVTGVILTLASNSQPAMPVGYDSFRYIGPIFTDGSSDIQEFFYNGIGNDRTFMFGSSPNLMTGGSSTTPANVNLGLNNVISGTTMVGLLYSYVPALVANQMTLVATGQSGSIVPTIKAAAAADIKGTIYLMANVSGTNGLNYAVTASDTLTLWLNTFTFSL